MSKKECLIAAIHPVMASAGFARQGVSWIRRLDGVGQILNLQTAQWGGYYFVNVCWWFTAEQSKPPKYYLAHIVGRWDSLVPLHSMCLQYLLGFDEPPLDPNTLQGLLEFGERPREMSERAMLAAALIEKHVIPFFEETSTIEQLKTIRKEKRLDSFGLRAEALAALQ